MRVLGTPPKVESSGFPTLFQHTLPNPMGSHRDQYGRQLTSAKYFSELTTSQLRHLLLTRLPMSTGVDCWGADRATLLEMAAAHGLHELTYAGWIIPALNGSAQDMHFLRE